MRKRSVISAALLVGLAGLTAGLMQSEASGADGHRCCRAPHAGVLMFWQKAAAKKCANTRQPNSQCIDRCRKDMACSTGSAGTKGAKGKSGHDGPPGKGGTPGKNGSAGVPCPCKKA